MGRARGGSDKTPHRRLAGRYALGAPLGRGSYSVVHAGRDLLVERPVAIKLWPRLDRDRRRRLRSEVSALRILNLPGVVALLDEGEDEDAAFLVMERVSGHAFPGLPLPSAWHELSQTTLALLETLGRVHAQGIVHRDLKPENVLVDGAGRPTLLDFGFSVGSGLGSGRDLDHRAVGTPAYASPEQIEGRATDARSDLYALGVMLYEALSGSLPHRGPSVRALLAKRLNEPAPALLEVAPETPPAVARVVDRLLSRDPKARPASAGEVLGLLRGEASSPDLFELPWLGSREPLERLRRAARERRPVRVIGPAGSGRTHLLEVFAEQWRDTPCLWLTRATEPFGSLRGAGLELALGDEGDDLASALSRAERSLRDLLGEGAVLLEDCGSGLDRWTAELLERCACAGALVRSAAGEPRSGWIGAQAEEWIRLAPWNESDLRSLFAGPDRLFHLPSDGARELWLRCEGEPGRLVDEVTAWVRAGLARWSGAQLSLDRATLDRLRAGLEVLPQAVRGGQRADRALVPAELEDALAWIALASPRGTHAILAQARQAALWRVEAEAVELCERGLVEMRADGSLVPRVASSRLEAWPADERRNAHARLAAALAPADEGRLYHFAAAGCDAKIPAEASALAERLAREGQLGAAEAALTEGLLAARRSGDGARELELFAQWIPLALADFTPLALDRVVFELSRAVERGPAVVRLERLARAGVAALQTPGERALDELEAIGPLEDAELERCRQGWRMLAAEATSAERAQRVQVEIQAWAERSPSARVRASQAEWQGLCHYRRDEFLEAARCQERVVALATHATTKLAGMLNGASALMETSRFDAAIELARRARTLAAGTRHALYEERAEWILRSARYRKGLPLEPDRELVEAARQVGVRDQEALLYLTEAAIAWRAGADPLAAELAEHCAEIWLSSGKVWGGLLARSLAAASGADVDADEREGLVERALLSPAPEIAGQMLALLAKAGVPPQLEWTAVARALEVKFPASERPVRREVLSIAEVLAALGHSSEVGSPG